ncbi:hypothetical protein [Labedaea rhizosphaerae]|uniref:Uncharacterized protein n=1 Tax=Labedaea rhizosphaerae TaxID=598644 RepID=A0A4R6S522_LABRH|nr:hypothetical protein [Labedaea rhizosphaerae]TDP94832.1 hypothetical protein EV186_10564 [Labedaea rhizosphaerae]
MSEFWQSIQDALRPGPPPADAVSAMLRRAAGEPELVRRRHGHLWFAAQLLTAQMRLIRVSVWLASAFVMAFGVLVLIPLRQGGLSESVLAMIAPFVAAAGIAGVCGPERDPGLELTAATATSPRTVLVARVALVFGYDLVLALGASLALVALGLDTSGLAALIGAWLGPMALLSSLCLLLAVAVGTTAAFTVGLALWLARLLVPSLALDTRWFVPVANAVKVLWATNFVSGVLAAALLAATVVVVGRAYRYPSAA